MLPAYFYLNPKDENGKDWILFEAMSNVSAFKKLSHKSGFLVDYSRIENNELHIKCTIIGALPSQKINIDFNNVSEDYYRYNVYASNVSNNYNYNSVNPAIAGFNIITSKGLGTFSAMTGSYWSFKLQ